MGLQFSHLIGNGGTLASPISSVKNYIATRNARSLMQNSDMISLHLPLTPETKHLIREETLALMKPGSLLIRVTIANLTAFAHRTAFVPGSVLT
jgi:phosphoglycerate dehydrogenase-like enzyme